MRVHIESEWWRYNLVRPIVSVELFGVRLFWLCYTGSEIQVTLFNYTFVVCW